MTKVRRSLWVAAVLTLYCCSFNEVPPQVDNTLVSPSQPAPAHAPSRSPSRAPSPSRDREPDQDAGSAVAEEDGGLAPGRTCPPVDCDDHDPCTRDTKRTGVVPCGQQCVHTPITQALAGDHCCPAGMSATDDLDCEASCGNGHIDPGEECDGGKLCSDTCTILFDAGMVHRYSFEGSGTLVTDSVGGADGTLHNGQLTGTGDLVLDGAPGNAYVDLPNGLISKLTDITVEVWVTWRGDAPRERIFDFGMSSAGEDRPSAGTSFFMLEPMNSNRRLATYLNFTSTPDDASADRFVEGRAALDTDSEHYIAVSYDSKAGTLTLYLDGSAQGNRTGINGQLSQIDDRNVWIGRANFEEAAFRGTIHELRIYDRVLDPASIARNQKAGPDPDKK